MTASGRLATSSFTGELQTKGRLNTGFKNYQVKKNRKQKNKTKQKKTKKLPSKSIYSSCRRVSHQYQHQTDFKRPPLKITHLSDSEFIIVFLKYYPWISKQIHKETCPT